MGSILVRVKLPRMSGVMILNLQVVGHQST
jgi:hypothetical protein